MPAEGPDRALGASYRLTELIGRGAAGEVWRGIDRRTQESIAAKLLRPEFVADHELVGRFLRERSILVGLRHPTIVAVSDLVAEGEQLAIVMEYVGGGSLRTALVDGPLTPRRAVQVTAAVLDGLVYAHGQQVLHRDIKPDNVLLAADWQVKLSDFGIASLLEDRQSSTTGLVGTPEYLAPELLLTGKAGLPVDLYGTGVLLYELLAGRTPFAGPGTGYAIAHRHVTNLAPRLPVPDQLWRVLEQLLAKDPAARPTAAEAAELLRALPAAVLDVPALASQDDPEEFARAAGPLTEVRGLALDTNRSPAEQADTAKQADASAEQAPTAVEKAPVPDLGEGSGGTVLRAMPAVPATRPAEPADESSGGQPKRRRRRMIIIAAASVLVVALGIVWFVLHPRKQTAAPPVTPTAAPVQQQSPTRPTGLGISRSATWDPQQQTVELTITYSAERAPLRGPYLEVLPNAGGTGPCPAVVWDGAAARPNLSSVIGIEAACAWSVEPAPISARGSATATARIALPALGNDPAALAEWLRLAGDATEAAVSDGQSTSSAYPAQRLTGIEVVAPSRTVSGKTLRITLLPVWPNGADQLDPLFVSPPAGAPSTTLTAIAGGTSGVRFADGCSGALTVSDDGLVVIAQSVAEDCRVNATVGNFTDLASNTFAITTRGS